MHNHSVKHLGALQKLASVFGLFLLAVSCFCVIPKDFAGVSLKASGISESEIASALKADLEGNRFPDTLTFGKGDEVVRATAYYTLDTLLQERAEKMFKKYQPDYGAFVALDAETGKILALVSYTKRQTSLGNLALKAIFPAASVFKIVTAAAAIDQNKASPETVFQFRGANHTLYRSNVTNFKPNRWTRKMTLREAFAKSVNTVFGKMGIQLLKGPELKEYAKRFQFNEAILSDVPVQTGRVNITADDEWARAEVASGFNRVSVMSPLQGALMAAAIANDGIMMEPHLVERVASEKRGSLYQVHSKQLSVTMNPNSAAALRALMHETVVKGTSRKAFRSLLRRNAYSDIEIGGKTGSLWSKDPKGRCEWFVGYALNEERKIAVAALTVHEKVWRIKAAEVARFFLEDYFKHSAQLAVGNSR